MSAGDNAQLQSAVKEMYQQANDYADAHGGVDYGMNVLYGPPIANPDVMIVSAQGGGADKFRQREWPDRLVYLESKYQFGKRLEHDFTSAGLLDVLQTSTVATNVAFPQFPSRCGGFDGWLKRKGSDEWLRKSSTWLEELARVMLPKVVLTYGSHAFRHLVGRKKHPGVDEDIWRGVPVVGCGHLVQGSTKDDRNRAILLVREAVS